MNTDTCFSDKQCIYFIYFLVVASRYDLFMYSSVPLAQAKILTKKKERDAQYTVCSRSGTLRLDIISYFTLHTSHFKDSFIFDKIQLFHL